MGNLGRIPIKKISLLSILSMAVEALWSNRLRTSLTMLGIIIGIGSVIAVTSVGQGVQKATEQQIQALGTNVMLVLTGAARTGGISQGFGSASTLTWEDARAIAQQVPAAEAVTAYLQRGGQVVYGDRNASTSILGVDLNYPNVKEIYPQEGQFFTQEDLDNAEPVVVLGSQVRNDLFTAGEPAIGASIRIQNGSYRVVGVMESKGSVGGQDQDDRVYIPLTNMSSRIVGNNAINGTAISGFWVKAKDQIQLEAAQFQVTNLLRVRHNIYPPKPDDFRISNQIDIINTFSNVVGLFTVLVSAIAGISLVVGGIGIANIMLVSVVERTREIGIRKAIGATNSAILQQFLTEAMLVSLLGGAIGVLVGVGLSFTAAQLFSFPFVISLWSVFAGLILALVVGLIAGVIPAGRAAQLDPIAALRSE
ncbi:ABC transporter substrate-binding protein [[Phormidium ambiguum] IAM M-71]|uniref:ABC transporter substrate-binding protein n=1 Tax=[Phormidium ambiguum] IAM M-71 TaxID=454136 RepID=A0A1U7IS52_9CYAN|nr:ABC transporter permease [Phormidium ambiguum]OKH40202.1 ABC transporter substrate-binding protein [Phormidium ambiguum IAM M-71]